MPIGKIRAVVFDLDGTLIDSAPDLRRAVNALLAEEGRAALDLAQVIGMIGDGAQKLVERAFAATAVTKTTAATAATKPGAAAGYDPVALTARFLAHYEGRTAEQTRPYPNVVATLARLRAEGFVLGICTNKPERPTREILRDLDLDRWFAAVYGGDSIAGVRKPDPRLLSAVLDALGVAATAAVMVGDNANDVAVARAAGVAVIVRADGYTRVPAAALGADLVIDDFAELPAALARVAAAAQPTGP